MANPTERFFERPREWSRRKFEIFEGYLPQYANILGKRRGTVYLVDAFAGAGRYPAGDDWIPGSPLRAAQIAADLAAKRSYDLRCINVERDKRAFVDLSANTASYAQFVSNRQGPFTDHIDSILAEIGQAPALFFLDPFGVGGLEWETLSRIGSRGTYTATEVLINFNVPKFDRHAGWLDSSNERLQDAFKRLLNRVTGTTEWQHIWDEALTKDERYQRIVAFYLKRIAQAFGMSAAAYPVRTVDGGRLKYYLIFATRNRTALRIMGSIFYGVEKRYLQDRAHFIKAQSQQLSFLPDILPEPSIDELEQESVRELEQDILALLRERRRITFGGVQDTLVYKWIGRMRERHYRDACKHLILAGSVSGPERGIGIKDNTMLSLRRTGEGVPS